LQSISAFRQRPHDVNHRFRLPPEAGAVNFCRLCCRTTTQDNHRVGSTRSHNLPVLGGEAEAGQLQVAERGATGTPFRPTPSNEQVVRNSPGQLALLSVGERLQPPRRDEFQARSPCVEISDRAGEAGTWQLATIGLGSAD
jgi:hypothetical protein